MLGSALGSASGAVVTHESHFKRTLLERARDATNGATAQALYETIARDEQIRAMWEMTPKARVDGVSQDAFELARRILFDVVDQYAELIGRSPWNCWVDHSPPNVHLIRDMLELAPDAKFIHILRDGRAIAASILPLDFGPSDALSAGSWWVYEVAHGLAAELAFPDRVIRVRYEDLVAQPELELRRICDFAGLEFNPGMLNADALPKTAFVKGTHRLVGSAISNSRVSAWRTKLAGRRLELFEYGAGHMLDLLGYKRATKAIACQPTNLERTISQFSAPFRKLAKRWRLRSRAIRAERGLRADKGQPVAQ